MCTLHIYCPEQVVPHYWKPQSANQQTVEWEVERSLGRPKMDAEGGGKRGKRRGKKKKKKAGGGEESMDTGQGK